MCRLLNSVFTGIFLIHAAITAQPKPGWTQYLLSGGITCITAAQGRVWIGTYTGGLVSYDTASGAIHRYTNANSVLPCNVVRDLAAGPDNRLWVATDRGLVWCDGQTWGGFDTASVPWRSSGVFDVAVSPEGSMYVSLSNGGIYRKNGSAWESLLDLYPGFPMDLASRGVRLGCSDGALWSAVFNTESNPVSRLAGGKWTTWTGLQTTGFANDLHGGVWFAYRLQSEFVVTTPREKLVRGTDTSWDEFPFPDSVSGASSVIIDSRDCAWVQAMGIGNRPVFARRSASAWNVIAFPDSIAVKGSATWPAIDGFDRVWNVFSVSLYAAGETPRKTGTLISYVNGAWKTAAEIADDNLPYGNADALCTAGDSVWMVSRSSKNPGVFNGTRWDFISTSLLPGLDNLVGAGIDARGDLWLIGAFSCFERRTGGWVLHSLMRSTDPSAAIQCSAFDRAGNAWVSMAESFYYGSPLVNGYLLRYNGAAWTEVTRLPPGSDSMPGFTAMACAPDSSLWCIAVDSILMRYKPDSGWSDCRADLEKAGNVSPHSLLFDKKGAWLGTAAKGLWRWDSRGLTGFNATTTNLPGSMDVKPLAVDSAGAVWCRLQRRDFTCYYSNGVKYCYDFLALAGLGRFDGTAWTFFSQSNSGLPSDDVRSIAFDKKGRMWAGTSAGIGMFDPAPVGTERQRQRMDQMIASKNSSKASRSLIVSMHGKSIAADCAGKNRPQVLYDVRGRLVKARRIGSSIILRRLRAEK